MAEVGPEEDPEATCIHPSPLILPRRRFLAWTLRGIVAVTGIMGGLVKFAPTAVAAGGTSVCLPGTIAEFSCSDADAPIIYPGVCSTTESTVCIRYNLQGGCAISFTCYCTALFKTCSPAGAAALCDFTEVDSGFCFCCCVDCNNLP